MTSTNDTMPAPSGRAATTDLVAEMTERLLIDAGITAGMRVLDVGCGGGDVSLLLARLVGEQGQVLGIDRDAPMIELARSRLLGRTNVAFAAADLLALPAELAEFDAVVGRRVLMYQQDAVATLRGLARVLRPGGLVVFQEHDGTMVPASLVALPLHARVHRWMWQTVEREGANIHMGFELPSALRRAGLEVEGVRAEAVVQTPKVLHGGARIIRAMLPRIVRHGVATEEEIDVDTLDQRLLEERAQADATYIGDMVFGAWARKPC